MRYSLAIIILLAAGGAAAAWWELDNSDEKLGKLENIHGIPFPVLNESTLVTEKLAHADIYLDGARLARKVIVEINFTPHETKVIEAGVRENSFWLSYPRRTVYENKGAARGKPVARRIEIPLTDKIVDANGSVDLMFFASRDPRGVDGWLKKYEGPHDHTYWELHQIKVHTAWMVPSKAELKDYVKSKINREKPV